jgi:hypothetical protein
MKLVRPMAHSGPNPMCPHSSNKSCLGFSAVGAEVVKPAFCRDHMLCDGTPLWPVHCTHPSGHGGGSHPALQEGEVLRKALSVFSVIFPQGGGEELGCTGWSRPGPQPPTVSF